MTTRLPSVRFTSLLALSLSTLAACGGEDAPTPAALRTQLSSDLGNVLRESNTAFTNGTAGLPSSTTLALLDRVLGTDTQASLPIAALRGSARKVASRFTGGQGEAPGLSLDADAEVAYLNDVWFTDANHVGNGIYKVPAALVCTQITIDQTGHETETVDAECAKAFDQVGLRIRTAQDGDTLTFALQIDANHDEPLRLELTHTSIALSLDLDELQQAAVSLSGLAGGSAANVALSGELTGKLEVLGTAKAKASLSVSRALSIKAAGDGVSLTGPDAFVLSSAKSEVFAVTLDGAAKSGTLALDLGATALQLPFDDSRYALDLPGIEVTSTFTEGQPLSITHFSLGDRTTKLSINGQTAQTIDLNPDSGRAVDAKITSDDATGDVTIAVSPKLDLQTSVNHAVLGDEVEVYDVTRIQLDGSLHGNSTSEQLAVTGAFSIATNPASYGFAATTGQCVTSSDAVDADSGAPFTKWTVVACN